MPTLRAAGALLVAGFALGFAVQSPALGWVGVILTAYAIATPMPNRGAHAAVVLASSLLASMLRFSFVWSGLRLYGAGDNAAWGALGLGLSVGIVDRLPIICVLLGAKTPWRERMHKGAALWMPAAWLVGEYGMGWATLMPLNGWLLTQAHATPVVHVVSWLGQTATAFAALTLGTAFGAGMAHRREEWRVALGSLGLALVLCLVPARRTDASALRGVAALRLQRRAEEMREVDAELVVWPEAISRRPLVLEEGPVDLQLTAPSPTESTHVMGVMSHRSGRVQNGAMAMTNDGHVYWHRAKIAMAGMGERARFGIRLGNSEDLLAGEIEPVVQVGERRIGVLICSEVFNAEMRERATPEGVDLVVVLAGDAITGGEASGRELMLNASILAAAEQGVSIARASMRGVAALIGPDGTVHARVDSGHLRAALLQETVRREAVLSEPGREEEVR